jgi:sugar lactone lactonase YvrE
VERYRVQDDGLRFVERMTSPRLTNPNDVDAAPDGRLWVSNNPPWEQPSELVTDMLLGRRRGQVLLYRPVERAWSVAARRMLYPNGVAVDEPAEHLHVAGARGKLRRFPLDGVGEAEGPPTRRGRARGTLDNLMWADDGALWTTGHPDGLAFMRHVKDPAAVAPTEVFRVTPDPARRRRLQAKRAFRVDDGRVDAGSVALPVADGVAIGQVFDAGVMMCRP